MRQLNHSLTKERDEAVATVVRLENSVTFEHDRGNAFEKESDDLASQLQTAREALDKIEAHECGAEDEITLCSYCEAMQSIASAALASLPAPVENVEVGNESMD